MDLNEKIEFVERVCKLLAMGPHERELDLEVRVCFERDDSAETDGKVCIVRVRRCLRGAPSVIAMSDDKATPGEALDDLIAKLRDECRARWDALATYTAVTALA